MKKQLYYQYVRPITFFFDKYSSRLPRSRNDYSIPRTTIKSQSYIFLDLFQLLSVLFTIILAIILAIHQHFCSLLLSFTALTQIFVSSSDTLNPSDDNRLSTGTVTARPSFSNSSPTDNVHESADR